MTKLKNILLVLAFSLGLLNTSNAADLSDGPGNQCIPLTPSSKLASIGDNITLTNVIVEMMNDAIQVASDPEWIEHYRPTFIWASEAKIACGKAYGYLQSNHRDEQYLDKCECFYNRMQAYQY